MKEYDIRIGIHNHPRRPDDANYKVWDPKYVLSVVKDRDPRIGSTSDIGHWDVIDMASVLAEAHELVERETVTPADFRDFTFANAVRLYGLEVNKESQTYLRSACLKEELRNNIFRRILSLRSSITCEGRYSDDRT